VPPLNPSPHCSRPRPHRPPRPSQAWPPDPQQPCAASPEVDPRRRRAQEGPGREGTALLPRKWASQYRCSTGEANLSGPTPLNSRHEGSKCKSGSTTRLAVYAMPYRLWHLWQHLLRPHQPRCWVCWVRRADVRNVEANVRLHFVYHEHDFAAGCAEGVCHAIVQVDRRWWSGRDSPEWDRRRRRQRARVRVPLFVPTTFTRQSRSIELSDVI